MRVKSYKEAVRLANSAGLDAANRRMRKAGRKAMSESDFDHATKVTTKMLTDLGFDITSWVALAGIPRNEPDEPAPRKKSKRRSKQAEPVQLAFSFA